MWRAVPFVTSIHAILIRSKGVESVASNERLIDGTQPTTDNTLTTTNNTTHFFAMSNMQAELLIQLIELVERNAKPFKYLGIE